VSNSQIAVGEKLVQHNYGPGSTVNTIVSGEAQPPRERQKPVSQLPRDLPRLHGRGAEIDLARAAMGCGQAIQFCGPSGIGKTALLRHLSHRASGHFPDGVVYYRSRHESLDDLLMRIFEFLYESDAATRLKPTTAELERYLGAIEALFLLDDVDLDREDLETLLQTVPRSVFVLGSPERSLYEGESVRLRGLPQGAAVALVQDGLGRRLSGIEISELAKLCSALEGHPLHLVKAATRIRDEGATPAQLLSEASGLTVTATPPADRLVALLVADLPEEERRVLSLLASLDGAPLHVDHVAALTAHADAAAILADLEERRLAQSHGPRYSATTPSAALQDPEASHRWRSSLLTYFTDYAEDHRYEPERLREDLEPIIQMLRWGMTCAPYADVLRLARESGVVAELSGLWDAWRSILDVALEAARMIGDRDGEGWALHELGTRALCLGQQDEAARRLEEALRIREKLGDEPGASTTLHNIGHLPHLPPSLLPPNIPPWGPAWLTPLCIAGGIAILTAPVIPGLSLDGSQDRGTPPRPPPVTVAQPRPDRPPRISPPPRTPSAPSAQAPPETKPDGPAGSLYVKRQTDSPITPTTPDSTYAQPVIEPPITDGSSRPDHPIDDARPPPPPPPPESGSCRLDLLTVIVNFIRRQPAVVQRLLALDVPRTLAAEIDAVRRLIRELFGLDCGSAEIETYLRGLGGPAG
jgi:hypothetical protein